MNRTSQLLHDLTTASLGFRAATSLEELRGAIEASAGTLLGIRGAALVLADDDGAEARRAATATWRELPLPDELGALRLSRDRDGDRDRPGDEVDAQLELELARIAAAAIEDLRRRLELDELSRTVHFAEMFIGVLGHDLRNPLNTMMIAAQFLDGRFTNGDEPLARSVSRILSSGDRMTRMISQMLDLSRMRLGTGVELDRRQVSVDGLCRRVMLELEALGPGRTRLQVIGDASGSWDATRIEQVISNLAGNALQHSRADREVQLVVDGSADDHVRLTVHGVDVIPADLLPEIFEPFRSKKRTSKGLGVSLYIAQQIVEAHHGTISVDSTEAAGTTFTITLPRRPPPPRRLPALRA